VVDALVAEFAEDRFVGPEEAVHGRAWTWRESWTLSWPDTRRDLIDFRRDLHAHPETGYHEYRTTRRIALRLEAAGLRRPCCPRAPG